MPRVLRLDDGRDELASATDLFSFEPAWNLMCPTILDLQGEDCVPYELDDLLRLLKEKGVGPMTRAAFSVEDIDAVQIIDEQDSRLRSWQETMDRLLVANARMGDATWRMRALLSGGANPNTACEGEAVLHIAIRQCQVEAFYTLLDAGASLRGALRVAVLSGSIGMLRRVYAATREAGDESLSDAALLDLAACRGDAGIMGLLVDELGLELRDECHPMYRAIVEGQCDVVRFFLERDPTLVKSRRGDGRCPLTTAAAAGQTEVIDLLVDQFGMNPRNAEVVCTAARHNRVAALYRLRIWCGDAAWEREVLKQCDGEGETPVLAALRNGAYDAMQTLCIMGGEAAEVLFELIRADNGDQLKEMLEIVSDEYLAQLRYDDGATLVVLAVQHESVTCIAEIIECAPMLWLSTPAAFRMRGMHLCQKAAVAF